MKILEIKPAPNSELNPECMENFLNLLHAFKFRKFHLQILKHQGYLHLILKVPNKLSQQIINSLYANYPNCQIKPLKKIPKTKSKYNLKLNRKPEETIKTYKQIPESLSSLLQNISHHLTIKITPTLKNNTPQFKTKIYSDSIPTLKSFSQFNAISYFKITKIPHKFKLNSTELATIFHLPTKNCQVQNLNYIESKTISPPLQLTTQNPFAKTNHRHHNQIFGIKTDDQRRHIYIVGKTGMGKSTLLQNMITQNIQAGHGIGLIDPHGDLAEAILNNIPKHRSNDLIYFNPADTNFPIFFNPLNQTSQTHLVISSLLACFKKLFSHSWGPRLEYILRNTLQTLNEIPGSSLLMVSKLLTDKDFLQKQIPKIQDPVLQKFWRNEFQNLTQKQQQESIAPILNKIGQFMNNPITRNILSQTKNKLDLRFAMDTKKIIIINLSKGLLGEDTSMLLGSLLISKFQIDAMSRANIPEQNRQDFYLYIDEFQNFATESFTQILSEARKYRLNLTMANQYLDQMELPTRQAIFGNIGTLISFQVGSKDAFQLSKEFSGHEQITDNDLINLPKYQIYTRLLVNGIPTKTFSATTLSPTKTQIQSAKPQKLIQLSRQRYAVPKSTIETKIKQWST